jgi:hypothetical protein
MKVHIDVLEIYVAVFDLPDLHLGQVIELLTLHLVVLCLFLRPYNLKLVSGFYGLP